MLKAPGYDLWVFRLNLILTSAVTHLLVALGRVGPNAAGCGCRCMFTELFRRWALYSRALAARGLTAECFLECFCWPAAALRSSACRTSPCGPYWLGVVVLFEWPRMYAM